MILKSAEKTDVNEFTLEISVEKPEFEAAIERAYHRNAGRFNVQGFRRGKAPRRMIERVYGPTVFYEDAINIAFPDAYAGAVKESNIEPVGQPELELIDSNENGFTFKAKVVVKPEVSISAYKGLEVEVTPVVVTDEDVEKELERRRKRAGRLETVDRPAATGDTVVIDFEGFLDGVPFEGGKSENHSLKLGSGQFIPGFEDQLVGAKTGDEIDVNVTFPENYQAAELSGKPVVFKVKVHEVKEDVLPELDDDFAKDVSEFETLEAFKADIREKLIKVREKSAEEDLENRLIDKLIENMQVELPQVMVEHQLDHIAEDFDYRMRAQGITLDAYLKMNGMDIDGFRATFKDQAERQVKTRLALEYIMKAENFEITDEDVEAEYAKLSEQYKIPLEELKERMAPDLVKEDIRSARAIALLKETAVKTEPKEDGAETKPEAQSKPAAKTGTKPREKSKKTPAEGETKAEKIQPEKEPKAE